MADTSTLERRPGAIALRVESPEGWTPPEGTHVFVFGSDQAGWTGFFGPSDRIQIDQTFSYGAARFLRSRARVRGPGGALPAGWSWEAYARVGSADRWSYEAISGRVRDLSDLAISTQGLAGSVDLRFGLRVVGPSGADPVELEIPAFYLDEIVLDEVTDGLIVANRSPQPGAVGVGASEVIAFDLMDTTSSPDTLNTQIWIEGVLAYDGLLGGAQPGYATTVSTPSLGVRRFSIALPYAMDSLRVMDVRVVSQNLLATHLLDTSWSFTVEDLTAPRLTSAVSRDLLTIRMTFDEAVTGADVPSAYSFTRLEAPSVNVEALSVTRVTSAIYDVALNIPITRGLLYRVDVAGVLDVFGNEIGAPFNSAEFRAFECPTPATRRASLWEWIPLWNREQDMAGSQALYRFISTLQEVVDLLLCDVDAWTDILDPDIAAERYLDQMLIQLGNPFAFELSVADKRRLIRIIVEIYRFKGTKVGIISVIRFFLGVEVDIVAYLSDGWILGVDELGVDTVLGPGTSRARFSFDVVSPVVLTAEQRTRIRFIVDYMKPAHTHHINTLEPTIPTVIDHLELGLSVLGGSEWALH